MLPPLPSPSPSPPTATTTLLSSTVHTHQPWQQQQTAIITPPTTAMSPPRPLPPLALTTTQNNGHTTTIETGGWWWHKVAVTMDDHNNNRWPQWWMAMQQWWRQVDDDDTMWQWWWMTTTTTDDHNDDGWCKEYRWPQWWWMMQRICDGWRWTTTRGCYPTLLPPPPPCSLSCSTSIFSKLDTYFPYASSYETGSQPVNQLRLRLIETSLSTIKNHPNPHWTGWHQFSPVFHGSSTWEDQSWSWSYQIWTKDRTGLDFQAPLKQSDGWALPMMLKLGDITEAGWDVK